MASVYLFSTLCYLLCKASFTPPVDFITIAVNSTTIVTLYVYVILGIDVAMSYLRSVHQVPRSCCCDSSPKSCQLRPNHAPLWLCAEHTPHAHGSSSLNCICTYFKEALISFSAYTSQTSIGRAGAHPRNLKVTALTGTLPSIAMCAARSFTSCRAADDHPIVRSLNRSAVWRVRLQQTTHHTRVSRE